MKSIHLHIDRIVVDGLPHSARQQFATALEAGLREWAETDIAGRFPGNLRRRIQSLSAAPLRGDRQPARAAAQIVDSIRQGTAGKGPERGGGPESRTPTPGGA